VRDADVDSAVAEALLPFGEDDGETQNPYSVHQELQQTMNDLVGIIRKQGEMEEALRRLAGLRERAGRVGVEGHRQFNTGWHLALDLRNMLLVSECVARAALERTESRGGHTRDDHPGMNREWRKVNLVCALDDSTAVSITKRAMPAIRSDLLALFEKDELLKYLTDEEVSA
jgi:succinate dehydrogenase / fumarate reductase, flavoprotein subunit